MDTADRLLTPGEVAALFRVDPKTVTRWAATGRLRRIRTPGGHARFRESEVRELLEREGGDSVDDLIPQPKARTSAAPAQRTPATPDAEVVARNNRGW